MRRKIFDSPPHFFSVDQVFNRFNIPIDFFSNPNNRDCIERINHLEVDILFNAQPIYLKEGILGAPKICSLNMHTGKLPEFRGVEPVFHALLNEKK
jgi:methionyl-tRNA formyltransferase